ncbi:MAG: hypothetical protein EHM58_14080 [Ignavibacteriae bacterium]|nr:MAG: hypothetical protein EHM58_14080 [Ignavibacteriota bacterium]
MSVKTKKILIWSGSIFLLLLILLLPAYYGYKYFAQKNGIAIKPIHPLTPYNVKTFLQDDELWGNDVIGNSSYHLNSSGCLISIIATNLEYQGYPTNPKNLNQLLSELNVYNNDGEILWENLIKVFPEYKYSIPRIFTSESLQAELDKGVLPMVKVKYNKVGPYHWVLIVGAADDDFLIVDPLNSDKDVIGLSKHGKIFAVRYLKRVESL